MNLHRLRLIPAGDQIQRSFAVRRAWVVHVAGDDKLRSGGVFRGRIDLERREEASCFFAAIFGDYLFVDGLAASDVDNAARAAG